MTLDEHIKAFHDLLRRDHEDRIAEIQGWADEAEANGDLRRAQWHRDRVARLEAIPKPWVLYAQRQAQRADSTP